MRIVKRIRAHAHCQASLQCQSRERLCAPDRPESAFSARPASPPQVRLRARSPNGDTQGRSILLSRRPTTVPRRGPLLRQWRLLRALREKHRRLPAPELLVLATERRRCAVDQPESASSAQPCHRFRLSYPPGRRRGVRVRSILLLTTPDGVAPGRVLSRLGEKHHCLSAVELLVGTTRRPHQGPASSRSGGGRSNER